MIRIWQSFSCNNSSSFRLVARFADAKTAKDVGAELAAFFTEHAGQMDALMEETGDLPDGPTPAAQALATKYGFEWKDYLTWGDEMLAGDEPQVGTEGDVLVVHHDYCGGGAGKDVHAYLTARGARDMKEDGGTPTVSVLLRLPKDAKASAKLRKAIAGMVGPVPDEDEEIDDAKVKAPWSTTRREPYGEVAAFSDGKTMGFYAPVFPQELGLLRDWLAKHGVEEPSIRLCEYGDAKKFRVIARARCFACSAALEYLDPRTHGIDKEQLVCTACGGMYELSAFMPGPTKAKRGMVAAKRAPNEKKKKPEPQTTTAKKKKQQKKR